MGNASGRDKPKYKHLEDREKIVFTRPKRRKKNFILRLVPKPSVFLRRPILSTWLKREYVRRYHTREAAEQARESLLRDDFYKDYDAYVEVK